MGRGGFGCGCFVFLSAIILAIIVLSFPAFFLFNTMDSATVALNPRNAVVMIWDSLKKLFTRKVGFEEELLDFEKELNAKEKDYSKAADNANEELKGLALSYKLSWGILAALDILAGDGEYYAEQYADALKTYAEYAENPVTQVKYFSKDGNRREWRFLSSSTFPIPLYPAGDFYDGWNYDLGEMAKGLPVTYTAEPLLVSADTYRGTYRFHYTEIIIEEITGTSEDGSIEEVTVTKKMVLDRIEYEEDWSRLIEVLTDRTGYEPIRDDLLLIVEAGEGIERGEILWDRLDSAGSLSALSGFSGVVFNKDGYAWPAPGNFYVSSGFTWPRPRPPVPIRLKDGTIVYYTEPHKGIDIPGRLGSPVVAVADSVVTFSGWTSGGYTLKLRCEKGYEYVYMHLQSFKLGIFEEAAVTAGQIIADMGDTGVYSTGPHLHFELWIDGRPVDPELFWGWSN